MRDLGDMVNDMKQKKPKLTQLAVHMNKVSGRQQKKEGNY